MNSDELLDRQAVWTKRALLLVVIGLMTQAFSLVHVTPGSFMLFGVFGLGPVFVGVVMFGVSAYKVRKLREEKARSATEAEG